MAILTPKNTKLLVLGLCFTVSMSVATAFADVSKESIFWKQPKGRQHGQVVMKRHLDFRNIPHLQAHSADSEQHVGSTKFESMKEQSRTAELQRQQRHRIANGREVSRRPRKVEKARHSIVRRDGKSNAEVISRTLGSSDEPITRVVAPAGPTVTPEQLIASCDPMFGITFAEEHAVPRKLQLKLREFGTIYSVVRSLAAYNTQKAKKLYERMFTMFVGETLPVSVAKDIYRKLGMGALYTYDYDCAAKMLERVIFYDPDDIGVIEVLRNIYKAKGDVTKYVEASVRAIRYYAKHARKDVAVNIALEVYKQFPDQDWVLLRLGDALSDYGVDSGSIRALLVGKVVADKYAELHSNKR